MKRYLYGSLTLYWTIHSTTATFRSPVSISDSASVISSWLNSDRTPGTIVMNPNSAFSCRWTGTIVTDSMSGILRCGPGSVVRTYRPNRCTTATESAFTW